MRRQGQFRRLGRGPRFGSSVPIAREHATGEGVNVRGPACAFRTPSEAERPLYKRTMTSTPRSRLGRERDICHRSEQGAHCRSQTTRSAPQRYGFAAVALRALPGAPLPRAGGCWKRRDAMRSTSTADRERLFNSVSCETNPIQSRCVEAYEIRRPHEAREHLLVTEPGAGLTSWYGVRLDSTSWIGARRDSASW